jgi:hypothetical protein
MVRPATFGPDAETLASNAFQAASFLSGSREAARNEVDGFAEALRNAGVGVVVIDEPDDAIRPNAVFPNNWFSTHPDGTVVLYPMQAKNRRLERHMPVLETLRGSFRIEKVLDMTSHEEEGLFLEGTGSLVLDHDAKLAFACPSPRTDRRLLDEWCGLLGFTAMVFEARGEDGRPVYHTNVVLALGDGFAVFGAGLVEGPERTTARLSESRAVIELDSGQIDDFAGNMLALRAEDGSQVVAMSERAWNSLKPGQRSIVSQKARVVAVPLPTIEQSGGSARCMLAEVFLPHR